MMRELLRLAKLYWWLLAISTFGRVCMGAAGVPYARGHHVFSLVTLLYFAAIFYGAFCRRWRNFGLHEVALLTALLGLGTQICILLATVLSYAVGVETYFNEPKALGSSIAVGWAAAVARRLGGLVANTIVAAIIGCLGWALGPLLPEKS